MSEKNKSKFKKEFKELLVSKGFYWKTRDELKEDLKDLLNKTENCSSKAFSYTIKILQDYGIKEIPHHNKLNKLIILFNLIEMVILSDEGKKFNDYDIIESINEFLFKGLKQNNNN
jgi:hemerythrin